MRLPTPVVRRSVQVSSYAVTRLGLPFRQQRRLYDAVSVMMRPPRGTAVTQEEHGGVRCDRVLARGADASRAIVHFHGGGFCIGSPGAHRSFAGFLSQATGCAVVLPDYRLAPEHRYPAAHDDAERVWRALADQAVACSGDSAGGNLALSVALRMRDAGGPMPASLVLLSPGLDFAADRRSRPDLVASDIMLAPDWMDSCHAAYFGSNGDSAQSRLLDADYVGLPPTLVVAATNELLITDADEFSRRATAAGVDVTDVRGDGLWHIYPTQAGMVREADEAVARIAEFVRRFT